MSPHPAMEGAQLATACWLEAGFVDANGHFVLVLRFNGVLLRHQAAVMYGKLRLRFHTCYFSNIDTRGRLRSGIMIRLHEVPAGTDATRDHALRYFISDVLDPQIQWLEQPPAPRQPGRVWPILSLPRPEQTATPAEPPRRRWRLWPFGHRDRVAC